MCFIEKKILKQDNENNDNISRSWKLIQLMCGRKVPWRRVICGKKIGERGGETLDSITGGVTFSDWERGRSNPGGYHDFFTGEDLKAALETI